MSGGDLAGILPEDSQTVRAIYDYWKKRGDTEPKRGYLGGSSIGEECERKLWYSFRDCSAPSFGGRLYRLFNRGHREEPTFVEELNGIGCEVHEVGPDGKQFGISLFGGHFRGHCDGVALGIPEAPKTWHLLEMKTSNSKEFKKVKEKGVDVAKPVHFAQMQIYMSELKLTRALYMVVNKETDEIYTERLRYDATYVGCLKDKAERIIFSAQPPERISDRADAWVCKFCDARELCHGLSDSAVPVPELSCRQCCHATPERDGSWSCAAGSTYGTPCNKHLILPYLVSFAKPTDSLRDECGHVIEFTSDDGTIWHHGNNANAGQFSSSDLLKTDKREILPRGYDVKHTDGSTHPNIEYQWSLKHDGIIQVWKGEASQVAVKWTELIGGEMPKPNFTQETNDYTSADFESACVIIYKNHGLAEIRIDENQ